MKFTFDGRRYALGFEREHQQVVILRDGKHHTVKSVYPYTTVTLSEFTTDKPVVVSYATVGCLPSDKYSNALGRLMSLRALNHTLSKNQRFSKDFRAAMWRAYLNRGKQQEKVIEGVVTKVVEGPVAPLALLPAATEDNSQVVH